MGKTSLTQDEPTKQEETMISTFLNLELMKTNPVDEEIQFKTFLTPWKDKNLDQEIETDFGMTPHNQTLPRHFVHPILKMDKDEKRNKIFTSKNVEPFHLHEKGAKDFFEQQKFTLLNAHFNRSINNAPLNPKRNSLNKDFYKNSVITAAQLLKFLDGDQKSDGQLDQMPQEITFPVMPVNSQKSSNFSRFHNMTFLFGHPRSSFQKFQLSKQAKVDSTTSLNCSTENESCKNNRNASRREYNLYVSQILN